MAIAIAMRSTSALAGEAPRVILSADAIGVAPGGRGVVTVSLFTTAPIDGLAHALVFPPAARIAADGDGRPACATLAPGREALIRFAPDGGTPGQSCGGIDVRLPALGLAPLEKTLLLYRCAVDAATDAAPGDYRLPLTDVDLRDADGDMLAISPEIRDGHVVVMDAFPNAIVLQPVSGKPGEQVEAAATLRAGEEIIGAQADVLFDRATPVIARANGRPSCQRGPEILLGGTSFGFLPAGCDPARDCLGVRALVLALDNVFPIPDGSELFHCDVAIADTATARAHPLQLANLDASDIDGNRVFVAGEDGQISVIGPPTPTPTSSPSPTASPQPTATGQGLPPTVSPTRTAGGDGGCAVVPAAGGSAWPLLVVLGVLLWGAASRRHAVVTPRPRR